MAARRAIGIDAGGTKLLGGGGDDELTVHARVHRLWDRTDKASVLQKMVEEVTAALDVAPDAEAVGFGIPSLVDRTRAVSRGRGRGRSGATTWIWTTSPSGT